MKQQKTTNKKSFDYQTNYHKNCHNNIEKSKHNNYLNKLKSMNKNKTKLKGFNNKVKEKTR
jgi:hypothetical protein